MVSEFPCHYGFLWSEITIEIQFCFIPHNSPSEFSRDFNYQTMNYLVCICLCTFHYLSFAQDFLPLYGPLNGRKVKHSSSGWPQAAYYHLNFWFEENYASFFSFLHQVVIFLSSVLMYSLISMKCRKASCIPMMRRFAIFLSTLQCKFDSAPDLLEKDIAGSKSRFDIDKLQYIYQLSNYMPFLWMQQLQNCVS